MSVSFNNHLARRAITPPTVVARKGQTPLVCLTAYTTPMARLRETTLRLAGEPHFSTKTNGTGLGPATVRQLMERQGGGLSIASAPHRGTTVDPWLPVMSSAFAE